MNLSDFYFELPDALIARHPAAERTASRMLVLDGGTGSIEHKQFTDLLDYLRPHDLLVFNNTRVIPARLFGRKESGGRVEVLVERLLDTRRVNAQIRASKAPKPGSTIYLTRTDVDDAAQAQVTVLAKHDDLYEIRFDDARGALAVLNAIGHMPLPPYIDRADTDVDRERYQTVYAQREGAVAAPTAGLHFSEGFLAQCKARGVALGFVTLHVGAGTFQPVRVQNILEHKMHAESVDVDAALCAQVRAARMQGGRIVAIGTTAVRALESATVDDELKPFQGDTRIFIYPGYRFRSVDILFTNFHLPESTLIMLVSAFAGREQVLNAYRAAVEHGYRFFSYGDAMLVMPKISTRSDREIL